MIKVLNVILRVCSFLWGCCLILAGIGGIIISFSSLNTPTTILTIIFTIAFLIGGVSLLYVSFKKLKPEKQNHNSTIPSTEPRHVGIVTDNIQCQNTNASSESIDNNRLTHNSYTPQSQSSNSQSNANEPEIEVPATSDVYIEDNDYGIRHADNSPITDEDVPYLIQLGYEQEMQKQGFTNVEMLDLSHISEMNKSKKEYTTLPSFDELTSIVPETSEITSTDIFFLKYINGRTLEMPDIAQYWYYEYNLNYSNEIKKLISNELLVLENVNIQKLKVDELKDILRHFSLPLSGKKLDLQNRIYENIPYSELSQYFGHRKHYFSLTEKGKQLINSIFDSATKNLELENNCIDLILQYNFRSAYDLIQHFKHNTPAGRQNSSWNYNSTMEQSYNNIMKSHSFYYTLEKDRDLESRIRASVVFCHMYGSGQDNMRKIIKRVYFENGREFSSDAKNILSYRLL